MRSKTTVRRSPAFPKFWKAGLLHSYDGRDQPSLVIFAGSTHLSKSSALTWPSAMAASFSVVPFLCAFFAISVAL
jgi:hypothetical protein